MNVKRREGEGSASYFMRNLGMAAAACMWAEVVTLPIDTAKVRMQIQTVVPGKTPHYNGFVGTLKTISAEEGPRALFSGLAPGL